MMTARLQREIDGSTSGRRSGGSQGIDFRVWLARAFMPARADHLAVAHDHATYARIGTSGIQAFFSQA